MAVRRPAQPLIPPGSFSTRCFPFVPAHAHHENHPYPPARRVLLPLLLLLADPNAHAQPDPPHPAEGRLVYRVGHRPATTFARNLRAAPAEGYFDPLAAFRLALLREVKYPEKAERRGRKGSVLLEVHALTDGRVRIHRLLHATGWAFEEAVRRAVERIERTTGEPSPDALVCQKVDLRVAFRR